MDDKRKLQTLAAQFEDLSGDIFGEGNYQGWEREKGIKMPELRRLKGQFIEAFFNTALSEGLSPSSVIEKMSRGDVGFDTTLFLYFSDVVEDLERLTWSDHLSDDASADIGGNVIPDISVRENEDAAVQALYQRYLVQARDAGLG